MQIVWIPIEISLKFVPKDLINNIPALVQIMAWRRPGNKPLSESMMVSLLTHVCVTWPQWVNSVSTIPIHIGGAYLVSIAPADGLAPYGAKPSQDTILTTQAQAWFCQNTINYQFFGSGNISLFFFFKSCKLFSTTRLQSLPFLIT